MAHLIDQRTTGLVKAAVAAEVERQLPAILKRARAEVDAEVAGLRRQVLRTVVDLTVSDVLRWRAQKELADLGEDP